MKAEHYYCICGEWMTARVTPEGLQSVIAEGWREEHTGPGHAPTDKATCRRNRAGRKATAAAKPSNPPPPGADPMFCDGETEGHAAPGM